MAMAAPRKLRGHKATATCCIASRDRPGLVVTSGEDGCVCWFDLRCKDVQFTIDVGTEPVSSLCFKTGNEDILYASHGNEIKSFDVHMLSAGSWKPLESYSYNKDEVNQVVCNGRSSFLASADDSGDVKIIDVGQKCLYKTLRAGHTSICSSVQFIPWRPWEVITGGLDAKLVLWDFSKGRSQKIIDFSSDNSGQCLNPAFVHSIAVPEMDMVDKLDKICAVARGDGIVDLINIESELSRKGASKGSSRNNVAKRVCLDYSVGGHKAAVSCVAFSQFQEKGRFLISGGNDKSVKIWDCVRCLDSDNNDNRDLLHLNIDLSKKVNWLCTNQSDSENLVALWAYEWLLDPQVSYLLLLKTGEIFTLLCLLYISMSQDLFKCTDLSFTMKPPQSQPLFHLFLLLLLIATVSSSSPLDPKQLKALKILTTTKDPCSNHSSTTITCDDASPFRRVTSLSFANCSSSLSLPSKTLKPLSTSLLSLSFLNCPSLSPPKHLPISLRSFSAVSSFHRHHGLSGVYLARLVNLTRLSIFSVPVSASGLYVVLGNMRNITSLTISSANLPGKIPKAFHSNLTYMDLSNNILTGPLRPSITLLTGLKSLNLSRNSLSGEIPNKIGDLTLLKNLSLASNRFSGPVPSSVPSLSQLTHLDLSGNRLNGVVPSFFSGMKSLRHLNLADNSFHGVLPFNETFIKNLEFFQVRGNSGLCYNNTVLSWKLNLGIAPCDKYGLPLSSPPQKQKQKEEEDDYDDNDGDGDGDKKEEKHGSTNKVVLGVAIALSSLVFFIVFLILLAKWSLLSK
uniref:Leucine-rich repeat and WD repeat-containing protein 1 n=1 Tax=Brassica campestris TaxID=3711 RepID=A0A3P5Y8S3_BRACM|nr:unnamed protein product [Brassica rapa]